MQKLSLIALAVVHTACSQVTRGDEPSSETTSVDMNLPDRGGLKPAVPDIEIKMNAFRLVVAPVDATCVNATRVDQLEAYVNSAKISASLVQGCDYDVTLALGHRPTDQDQAAAKVVSYEGQMKTLIESQCLKCHNAGGAQPTLASYDDVLAVGDLAVDRVQKGKMPIGGTLSAEQKALFLDWQKADFAEKDAASLDSTKLSATYYKNDTALRVTKEQIQGQAALRVSLPLKLQADGVAIGLGK